MQLEIDGIGQQKYTLSMWKKDNGIKTHCANHLIDDPEEYAWTAVKTEETVSEHCAKFGDQGVFFGDTEKEVIRSLCIKEKINLPFWW